MVAAVGAQASGLSVRAVSASEGDSIALVSQFPVRVAFNYPSAGARISSNTIRVLGESGPRARVSQLVVRSIVRGHVENPRIRAWTFTLDGHDFYVLRLADRLTLVYDVYSEQWVDWQDFTHTYWRPNIGTTWGGAAALAHAYGSSVIAGDDSWGLLWFLDPDQPYDEHPDETNTEQTVYFERITMGQVPMRGRENLPCFAAWLTTDMGEPAYDGAGVRLEISDDGGRIFDDMGLVEITAGADYPELAWYSLGQIEAPGRLFRLTDDGAIARIDGLEMNDPDDEK